MKGSQQCGDGGVGGEVQQQQNQNLVGPGKPVESP